MNPPFLDIVRQRVVVLDGAMGSNLQMRHFDMQTDWMGHENMSEVLNFTRPQVIQEIHESFLAVGCDAVETNTFGANAIVMAEAGMAKRVAENNRSAAQIARRACEKFALADQPRYVIGAIGPGTRLITLGQTTWEIMEESYFEQICGLMEGGVDALLMETQQDLLAIKCCLAAADRAFAVSGRKAPIMVQASMDQHAGAQMLTGSDVTALVAALRPYRQVEVLGLNCAFGPNDLAESIRYIAANFPRFVSLLPNAGLPVYVDGHAHFPMAPADFTNSMMKMVNDVGLNIVGGCCGTMPEHLKMLCQALGRRAPKARAVAPQAQVASLMSAEDLRQDASYLVVAERTNTNGSRQFKRLLQADDWDGLVSMARDEVRGGSQLLDVCVDFVGRNSVRDMSEVAGRFVRSLDVPLMLDSTSPAVMEAGLKLCGGRCVINSMNLEDGEGRVALICALARKYGAAVVAGTIDEDKEQAMARTRQRKLDIARRLRQLAHSHGLSDQDLLFDPLVLPISTGIEADRKNAVETIEGVRLISAELPECHSIAGVSNVSFGLKPAARVVLNSAFLHELCAAGLTAAIVHASKILPANRIPPTQWQAAMDLIYDRRRQGFDPLTAFVSLFPDTAADGAVQTPAELENLSLEEKLKRHIIDGERRDLAAHLDEARGQYAPLQIINQFLLEGMKVVGDLFGSGQMQLPFVLQSAETMKAAVAHLQPYMDKVAGKGKGSIVLATVRGDVHDIGKNLADIILTNNGYTVYNLGIKQSVHDILQAAREKGADAIGMSGLLVKSVGVMKENLEEFNTQGVKLPVLLGGAALTRDYAEDDLATLYQGPLFYCKDVFDGLKAMDAISAGQVDKLCAQQKERSLRRRRMRDSAVKPLSLEAAPAAPLARDNPVPLPPFWGPRVVWDVPAAQIFPYINEDALFRGQWGLKQGKLAAEEFARLTEQTARPVFQDLQRRCAAAGILQPRVVYGYFPVQSQRDELIVYNVEEFQGCTCHSGARCVPSGTARRLLSFTFPRQEGRRRLCISDYFRSVESGQYDVLGVQLVTIGDQATIMAEKLRAQDKYRDYLYLHGFAVESAEALAELWHKRMRRELGFGAEDASSVRDILRQGYRGSRYSFGYPACPNLEDRAKILELLQPQVIGVSLSENFMLVPEQSTDALIVHHPQAKYFDV